VELTADDADWSVFDRLSVIAMALVLAAAFAATVYGSASSFIVSTAYADYNRNVAYACGAIAGCAGLYVGWMLVDHLKRQAFIGLTVVGALFGYVGAMSGLPAIAANISGTPGQVLVMKISNPNASGRRCSQGIELSHPDFETKKMCGIGAYAKPRFKLGDRFEFKGSASYWGFHYESFRRLP
jgi:hypothetical protein